MSVLATAALLLPPVKEWAVESDLGVASPPADLLSVAACYQCYKLLLAGGLIE